MIKQNLDNAAISVRFPVLIDYKEITTLSGYSCKSYTEVVWPTKSFDE